MSAKDDRMRPLLLSQLLLAGVVGRRLARGRTRRPPLRVPEARPAASVSVVVPARDEAARIGPCLEALRGDPDALEVLVVDDRSTDGTAALARELGASVLPGRELPAGWVGKPWALQQGLEAARGEIVVCLDADTRPRPGLLPALAGALAAGADYVTVGARFRAEPPAERFLHPSLLASLVYRYGPQDTQAPPPVHRLLANGQCTAARRVPLLAAGGFAPSAGHLTDDAAQARALARAGWRVEFRDGADLLEVEMLARDWGRSIALHDVTAPATRLGDLLAVWLVMALPVLRLALGRPTPVDLALLVVRLGLTGALGRSYARRGLPFWLSPLADPATAVRLTLATLRPAQAWRGRTYPAWSDRARRGRR